MKRGTLDGEDIVFLGSDHGEPYCASIQFARDKILLSTRHLVVYAVPIVIALVMYSFFVYAAAAPTGSGPQMPTGWGVLIGLFVVGVLLFLKLPVAAGTYDRLEINLRYKTATLCEHRLFKEHVRELALDALAIYPTELYRTRRNAFTPDSRSKSSRPCEVLRVNLDGDAVYYLLWASRDGRPRHLEWLHTLHQHVRVASREEAGFDAARVAPEFSPRW